MRNQNPHEYIQKVVQNETPALQYLGDIPFEDWQKTAYRKLSELLGMDRFSLCDDNFQIEFEREKETYKEIRFTFQSEPGYFVPCHLLIPHNAQSANTVICLQGHSKGMHISLGMPKYEGDELSISGGDRDFAIRAVQEGFCALTIEQRDMGECGGNEQGPQCYIPTMANLLIGRTTIGERVWDVSRAIDILEKYFPNISTAQLCCLGNSGGGTATYYAACMEKRIYLAMPSCAVCTYDDSIIAMHHCACNFIPHIREFFNMGDLSGLIAPRRLLVVSGKDDSIFPLDGVRQCDVVIQKMFDAAGVKQNYSWVIGDGGHRFYADAAWPVAKEMLKS